MSKHTPGPWKVDGPNRFGGLRVVAPYKPTCTYLVAEASPDCPDDAATQANAHLISAAPDLLEACKLFVQYDSAVDDTDVDMMLSYAKAKEAIRAAISKAEGVVK